MYLILSVTDPLGRSAEFKAATSTSESITTKRAPLSSRLENDPFPAKSVARTVSADAIVKL